jgi:hypothetical protein
MKMFTNRYEYVLLMYIHSEEYNVLELWGHVVVWKGFSDVPKAGSLHLQC